MILYIILFISGLVTFDDLADYWSGILNIKYGTLERLQYFACTWLSTFVISTIGSTFLSSYVYRGDISPKSFEFLIGYGSLYLIITAVQLSAFFRRLNDARLSHWYALVFLIPGIGNIIAFVIALLPPDFGSPY